MDPKNMSVEELKELAEAYHELSDRPKATEAELASYERNLGDIYVELSRR